MALTVDARAREDDAREDDAPAAREDEHADDDVARDVCAEARRATVASRAASMVAGRGVTFELEGRAARRSFGTFSLERKKRSDDAREDDVYS